MLTCAGLHSCCAFTLKDSCVGCVFISAVPTGSAGGRMCDFIHCSVAFTAEHSYVYGESRREGSSNPLIYSTSDLACHLCLAHSITHPPPDLSLPLPSLFGLILASPHRLRHPRETNSDRCSTPSWHVGQGRWSPFRFSATTSLPPPPAAAPLAASQHFLNMPGTSAG